MVKGEQLVVRANCSLNEATDSIAEAYGTAQGHRADENGYWTSPPKGDLRNTPRKRQNSTGCTELQPVLDRESALDRAAIMTARKHMAFLWREDEDVKLYHQSINAASTFSRKEITGAVNHYGAAIKEEVVQKLSGSTEPVTLAIDSVKNINDHHIYSVNLLQGGRSYFYCGWNIKFHTDIGAIAADMLVPIIDDLLQRNVHIVAIISDNGPPMKSCRIITANRCKLLQIGCAAHLLHNTLGRMGDKHTLLKVIEPFKKTVSVFTQRKEAQNELDERGIPRVTFHCGCLLELVA